MVSEDFDAAYSESLRSLSGPDPDRHLIDLLGPSQRLSLSLGTQNSGLLNPGCTMGFDYSTSDGMSQSWSCYGAESIGVSKYLQPAQSLLEEMLSIGGINVNDKKFAEKLCSNGRKGSFSLSSKIKAEISNAELVIDKHEDYVNLLKLIALLEEVERRYEEYSHHMEELVSSFEAIAGYGAAKSYTTLALLAMSKHFCRLRNAILSQIHIAKKKITKNVPKISSRLSQLSLFDQENRQNRIIMHNSVQAWRPLRGLPETSVTILRSWLFEHFLHPYPNDSEKLMLASQTGLSKNQVASQTGLSKNQVASQTGLSKNQVSNWFINARVRLWKPMIEEMYKEEFEESSTESDQLLANSLNELGD